MGDGPPIIWCHECLRETEPQAHEWACSLCDGGFIEALDEDGRVEGTGVISVAFEAQNKTAQIRYPLALPLADFQQRVCETFSILPETAAFSLHDRRIEGEGLTLGQCGVEDKSTLVVSGTWVESAGERGLRLLRELEPRYEDAQRLIKQLEEHIAISQQEGTHDEAAQPKLLSPRAQRKEALRINELFMRMLETLDSIQTDASRPEMRDMRKRHVVNIQQRQGELDALTRSLAQR